MKRNTICVHAGTRRDLEYLGTSSPIHVSTSYAYLDSEERIYPRYFNTPNQEVLVEKLCALEGAEDGLFLSSGMAAVSTLLLTFLKKGDHAIFQPALYGGTFHMAGSVLRDLGIDYSFGLSSRAEDLEKEIRPNTKLIYIETPSNPLLEITDIAAVAEMARKRGVLTAIDNTFASPVNQNPYQLGIDIVLHSATKYLGGHSDLAAGALVSSAENAQRMRNTALNLGGSLNALDCYLMERSMKTLSLRVERQNESAMKLAHFLNEHEKITRVFYPGLDSHPGHAVAARQMSGFGGMLSFELRETDPTAFQKALQLIKPSMSLGGVDTIICSPALTSHRHLTAAERTSSGITENVLRLSVGIEEVSDLVDDLAGALG